VRGKQDEHKFWYGGYDDEATDEAEEIEC